MSLQSLLVSAIGIFFSSSPASRLPEPKNTSNPSQLERLVHTSVQGGHKQWRLLASSAEFDHEAGIMRGKDIKADLFNASGDRTEVWGNEAKSNSKNQQIEIFGNVRVRLSDGFMIECEHFFYETRTSTWRTPEELLVKGYGKQADGSWLKFQSSGLHYGMNEQVLKLLSQAHVRLEVPHETSLKIPSGDELRFTEIISDSCCLNRLLSRAEFSMKNRRKSFVLMLQADLSATGREAILTYRDYASSLDELVLQGDVKIQEHTRSLIRTSNSWHQNRSAPDFSPLRYSTSQHALFESATNRVVLTQYPQVYTEKDTLMGERILLHRTSGMVEIEEGNAFRRGRGQLLEKSRND